MSASAGLSTSTAIVLAGGLIAVGVFLGLRSRAPSAVHAEAAAPAKVITPPIAVAPAGLVVQQASEALAYQRTRLRDVCYRPAAIAAGAALPAAWILNVTFDARGVQLARGMEEQRGTSTPELTRCIGEQLQPLLVPPPGATVMVEVPLRFP